MKINQNNMKLIVLLAGLTAFTVSGLAQSQQKSIISGKVQDATNKSIQTVTVSLLKAADSSLVKAALTDATGNYEIAVTKSGKFLVRYESLGYEKKYAAAFEVEAGKDYSLPVAVLKIEVKKLQDVKKKIEDYLKEYNKDKGYSYIFSGSPDLMYFKDTVYNITGDMLKGLNEMYKKKK